MQFTALEPPPDLGNRAQRVVGIAEVDLDVILGPRVPRALFRKRMPRAGDDAPAGRGKADHGRVPDAAARTGEQQRPPRQIGRGRHSFSRLSVFVIPGCAARRRPGIYTPDWWLWIPGSPLRVAPE